MAKNGNKSLGEAKKQKKDEFYTQLFDINAELRHYTQHFADKVVFPNICDGDYVFKLTPELMKESDIVVTNPPYLGYCPYSPSGCGEYERHCGNLVWQSSVILLALAGAPSSC